MAHTTTILTHKLLSENTTPPSTKSSSSRRSKNRNDSPPTNVDDLIATLTGHNRHGHHHHNHHQHQHQHQHTHGPGIVQNHVQVMTQPRRQPDAESHPIQNTPTKTFSAPTSATTTPAPVNTAETKSHKKRSVHLNTLLNNDLYKTEMCRSFEETGSCRYGSRCQFAHGANDLRIVERHPRYKTEICKTFIEKGFCAYGKRCRFLHSLNPNAAVMANGEADAVSECESHEMEPASQYDIDYPPCARKNLFATEPHNAASSSSISASSPVHPLIPSPATAAIPSAPNSPDQAKSSDDEFCGHTTHEPTFEFDFDTLLSTEHDGLSPLRYGQMHRLKRTQGTVDHDADSILSHELDHCYGSEHSFGHDSESDTRSLDSPTHGFDIFYGYWALPRVVSSHRRLPVFEQIAN